MDQLTQLQNYIKTESRLLTTIIEDIHTQNLSVSLNSPIHNSSVDISDKAASIFKLFQQSDALMASLPKNFNTKYEQEIELKHLEELNKEAGERLKSAEAKAVECQSNVLFVLQEVADRQLKKEEENNNE